MRDYARTSPTFWTRGTGKRLRGDKPAQLLAWYLMTAPQGTMTGIFQMAIPTVMHETGMTEAEIRGALVRLEQEDFASYDEDAEVVFVHNAIVWQVGKRLKAEDKRVTGIVRELESIGQHRFVSSFVSKYGDSLALGESFSQAPSRPLPSPIEAPSRPLPSPIEAPSRPLPSPIEAPSESLRSQAKAQAQAQAQEGAGAPMPAPAPACVPTRTRTRESAGPDPKPLNAQSAEILAKLRSLPALDAIATAATAEALASPVILGKWAMFDVYAGLEDYAEVTAAEGADGHAEAVSAKRARNFVQRAWVDRCSGKARPGAQEPDHGGLEALQPDQAPRVSPEAMAGILGSMAGAGAGGGAPVARPGRRA